MTVTTDAVRGYRTARTMIVTIVMRTAKASAEIESDDATAAPSPTRIAKASTNEISTTTISAPNVRHQCPRVSSHERPIAANAPARSATIAGNVIDHFTARKMPGI